MSDNTKDKDYEVGYGRPPEDTQFKPGQSGNPKGRPKGSKNFSTVVNEILNSKVTVSVDGKTKKITRMEAYVLRLSEKALKGDVRSIQTLMELAEKFNNEDETARDLDLSAEDMEILETSLDTMMAIRESKQSKSKEE